MLYRRTILKLRQTGQKRAILHFYSSPILRLSINIFTVKTTCCRNLQCSQIFGFRAYTVTDQWRYHEKYQKPTFRTEKFTLALILRLCKSHIIVSGLLETLRVMFLLLTPQVLKKLLSILQNFQVKEMF